MAADRGRHRGTPRAGCRGDRPGRERHTPHHRVERARPVRRAGVRPRAGQAVADGVDPQAHAGKARRGRGRAGRGHGLPLARDRPARAAAAGVRRGVTRSAQVARGIRGGGQRVPAHARQGPAPRVPLHGVRARAVAARGLPQHPADHGVGPRLPRLRGGAVRPRPWRLVHGSAMERPVPGRARRPGASRELLLHPRAGHCTARGTVEAGQHQSRGVRLPSRHARTRSPARAS